MTPVRNNPTHAPAGAVNDRENLPPNFWQRLNQAWATLLGRKPHTPFSTKTDTHPSPEPAQAAVSELVTPPQRDLQPYNPQALPAAREQWQRGDWASLASLTLDELQDHPDRAKLALLAGAGHMQLSNNDLATEFVRQAKAWGVSETLIRKTMLANVHAQLARCWQISGDTQAANANRAVAQQLVSLRHMKNKAIRS